MCLKFVVFDMLTGMTWAAVIGAIAVVMLQVRIASVRQAQEALRAMPVYTALPSYEAMLLDPRHWHRWTVEQWRTYATRRAGE
jgi:hypothetical protein